MARVFVDVSIVSQEWFKSKTLVELIASQAVRFTYTKCGKLADEHEQSKKFGYLMKRLSDQGRTDIVSEEQAQFHADKLTKLQKWQEQQACDDAHIFALVYEKPTRYIFSADMRIAKCRDCLNQFVENRYCDFIVIGKEDVYIQHRQKILS